MALSAVRRALGKRIAVDLPIVGYGGAGIMLGGKKPVSERAGIGTLHNILNIKCFLSHLLFYRNNNKRV